jgi:AraC-like DNA-binding protein
MIIASKPICNSNAGITILNLKQEQETYPRFYLYNRIVKAKLFIDKNFGEKIDLDQIADEAYFSKFHFVRLFKSIYGKAPHQYLIQVRIDNARKLLQANVSVTDTCYIIGFESISSFSALFKKCEGKTPSDYQQEYFLRQQRMKVKPLAFIPNCFAEQKGWAENSNFQ